MAECDKCEAIRRLCQRNFDLEDWYMIDANDVAAILGEAPF